LISENDDNNDGFDLGCPLFKNVPKEKTKTKLDEMCSDPQYEKSHYCKKAIRNLLNKKIEALQNEASDASSHDHQKLEPDSENSKPTEKEEM
jgi:hypothetical protein